MRLDSSLDTPYTRSRRCSQYLWAGLRREAPGSASGAKHRGARWLPTAGWNSVSARRARYRSRVFTRFARLYFAAYPSSPTHTALLVGLRLAGAAVVLFVPTFLMGGTLPVLIHGLSRSSAEVGRRLARLYWVNTAGAVAGAFAAGFLFLPAIGLQLTLAVAVALNLLAGGLALKIGLRDSAAIEVSRNDFFGNALAPPPRSFPHVCC